MYGVCLELSIVHPVVHILFIPTTLMIVLVALSLVSSTWTIKNKAPKEFPSSSHVTHIPVGKQLRKKNHTLFVFYTPLGHSQDCLSSSPLTPYTTTFSSLTHQLTRFTHPHLSSILATHNTNPPLSLSSRTCTKTSINGHLSAQHINSSYLRSHTCLQFLPHTTQIPHYHFHHELAPKLPLTDIHHQTTYSISEP